MGMGRWDIVYFNEFLVELNSASTVRAIGVHHARAILCVSGEGSATNRSISVWLAPP